MLYWEIENSTWTGKLEIEPKERNEKKKSKPRFLNIKQETFKLLSSFKLHHF